VYIVTGIYFLQRQEDVVALEQVEVSHKPLPPVGALVRPKPSVGDVMYVMKQSLYGVWSRARVLEVTPKGSEVCASNQCCIMTVDFTIQLYRVIVAVYDNH
jgi:hypothetical protein